MKATALKRRSNIIITAFAAASVVFVPQAARADFLDAIKAAIQANTKPVTQSPTATAKLPLKEYLKQNQPPIGATKLEANSVTRLLVDAKQRKIFVMGFKKNSNEETLLEIIDGFKIGPGKDGEQFGKKEKGDQKTPIGTYTITKNGSSQFGLALKINYPTSEQREKGYSGGDVEIHGGYPQGYNPANAPDWTNGCIALPDWRVIQLYNAVRPEVTVTIEPAITEAMLVPKKTAPSATALAENKKPTAVSETPKAPVQTTIEETHAPYRTAANNQWVYADRFNAAFNR